MHRGEKEREEKRRTEKSREGLKGKEADRDKSRRTRRSGEGSKEAEKDGEEGGRTLMFVGQRREEKARDEGKNDKNEGRRREMWGEGQ